MISTCRSGTFNKIAMLKRRHSQRPSKLQCVEPPRVINMQVASGANALFALFTGRAGSCLLRLCFPAAFKLFVYLLELQLHHLIRHNVDPSASELTKYNQIESYLH